MTNAFESVRPRGEDRPSAPLAPVKAGRPPLPLQGSMLRTMDRLGLWRVPLAPRQSNSICIEGREAARASEDKRQALKRGGL